MSDGITPDSKLKKGKINSKPDIILFLSYKLCVEKKVIFYLTNSYAVFRLLISRLSCEK